MSEQQQSQAGDAPTGTLPGDHPLSKTSSGPVAIDNLMYNVLRHETAGTGLLFRSYLPSVSHAMRYVDQMLLSLAWIHRPAKLKLAVAAVCRSNEEGRCSLALQAAHSSL